MINAFIIANNENRSSILWPQEVSFRRRYSFALGEILWGEHVWLGDENEQGRLEAKSTDGVDYNNDQN